MVLFLVQTVALRCNVAFAAIFNGFAIFIYAHEACHVRDGRFFLIVSFDDAGLVKLRSGYRVLEAFVVFDESASLPVRCRGFIHNAHLELSTPDFKVCTFLG